MKEEWKSEFEWNAPKGEPLEVLSSLKASHSKESLKERISADVVEMGSIFEQLRSTYLKAGQRKELANRLKDAFLDLQKVVSVLKDQEARVRLTEYLVLVGSIGVGIEEEELTAMLEALANRKMNRWVDQFYSAAHGLKGKGGRCYCVTEEILGAEQKRRFALMHWIEPE